MNKIVYLLPLLLAFLVSVNADAKKKKYPNGDYYEGEWKKGQPNGTGKMVYANGDVYEGEWVLGTKKNGKMIYANGNQFNGYWENNAFPKKGIMTYTNGDVYDGSFQFGSMSFGKMTYANGDVFFGSFRKDTKYSGQLHCANGEYYDGKWENGTFKSGSYQFEGITYNGTWDKNKFEGTVQKGDLSLNLNGILFKDKSLSGTVEYGNTARFTGVLKNMQRDGIGELTIHENNIIITGEWENDIPKHGHGSLTCNGMKIPLNITRNDDGQYTVVAGYPVKSNKVMSLSFDQLSTIPVKLVTPQVLSAVNRAKQEELTRKRKAERRKKEEAERQRQAAIAQKVNSFPISSYIWSTEDIRNLYNQNEVKFNKNLNGYDVIVTGIVKDFSIGTRTNHLFGISTQIYKIHLTDGIIIWTYDSENVENLVRGERIYALASYDGERTEYDELYLGNPDYGLVVIRQSIQDIANKLFEPEENEESSNPTLYYEKLKLVKRM